MDIKERWTSIVYKILHFNFDLLNEIEKKDLDKYFNKKIKDTLKGKQFNCIIFENGDGGFIHIIDDLRNEMVLFLLINKGKFLDLNKNELWKKFNNKSYNYLQEKYYKKEARHSKLGLSSATQHNYSDEELKERMVVFSELEVPILNIPEQEKIYDGDCIVYDSDGNIVEIKKAKMRKK